ncbi:MAG TPA: hypothetical protein VF460_12515 [Burkholderiales bacterium]
MEMDALSALNAAAAVATALGLAFAVIQLRIAARQSVTDFEDTMAAEYRALAASFPIEALLGGTLSDEDHRESLDEFYHYFDLSNGQVFLRRKGRVSRRTFDFWCSGIRAHLARPAFARAWGDISGRLPSDFRELRRLIAEDYKSDPKDWD